MDIKSLYNLIKNELEKEAINKFESKEDYVNWNQTIYNKYGYKAYGLRVPEINKIINKYLNKFKELSFEERINLIRIFYKAEYIAQSSFGLELITISLPQLTPQKFNLLDEICGYLTNWGPTDSFSLKVMQPLLRKHPKEVKKLLEKWNNFNHM